MLSLPDYREIPWWWLLTAGLLTAFGVAFVVSATWAPESAWGFGKEAKAQLQWWALGAGACLAAMHVRLSTWRLLALPLWCAGLLTVLAMMLLAGTALVPKIKGQANWLVLGSLRLQPVELIKLCALLGTAWVVSAPGFDARRWWHVCAGLAVAALPAALVAKEDLGSALTFPAMVIGMLLAAGMRWLHLAIIILAMAALALGAVLAMPRDSYQWKRVDAWLHPERYQLAEGFQTERAVRSIGSGQWTGKGWSAGEQNRLGWIPEKHTDMISAVVGEEVGFLGATAMLIGFAVFAVLGLAAAGQARDPFARSLGTGFTCQLTGQAGLNLAVATGLMPVTGVTLPFISYGGSSLLACYLGLGLCAGAVAERGRR